MELADYLKSIGGERGYEPCMSLIVNEEGSSVELCLDTSVATYMEHIEGEGADIGLLRCRETGRVVGCDLPLVKRELSVWHGGPIRVNGGFRQCDEMG